MNIEISAALPTTRKFDDMSEALKYTLRCIVTLAKLDHIRPNPKAHVEDAGCGMWNIWCDNIVGDGAIFLQVYEENCGFDNVCYLCIDGSDNHISIQNLPEKFIYYIIKQIIREFNVWFALGDIMKLCW